MPQTYIFHDSFATFCLHIHDTILRACYENEETYDYFPYSREALQLMTNGAFTVELADFIEDSDIDYWIYGHSHRNIDRTIGRTMCLSNQLGYVSHNEHETFCSKKIIEI